MGHSLAICLRSLHFDFSKNIADCSEISKAKVRFQGMVIEHIAASPTLSKSTQSL